MTFHILMRMSVKRVCIFATVLWKIHFYPCVLQKLDFYLKNMLLGKDVYAVTQILVPTLEKK